ncbi:MAG: flagellar basal body rod protein FlgF [Burkholderiales bacterium]|nr:flagellar basal body rod protein FlgF [Burkholderiales bacterium]
MDRLVFVAASGARQLLARQDAIAQNVANVSTPGYRAETAAARAAPLAAGSTRVFALEVATGPDLTPGPIESTGRPLDVALQGPGWIAVQAPDGREAYTRAGSLEAGAGGVLQTRAGHAVLGEGGPIAVPPEHRIEIARDGTVTAIPESGPRGSVQVLGRLKLVNPPAEALARGADGLFRTRDGAPAPADPQVALVAGALEGSNVNAAEALVGMIGVARQFELHMKLVAQAEDNARRAASLLNVTA